MQYSFIIFLPGRFDFFTCPHFIDALADLTIAILQASHFIVIYRAFCSNQCVTMVKDACYYKVKARYSVFPSARASQAIAKCRKANHRVHKSKAGKSLKRWESEKWKNTKTGRPCGNSKDKTEYCRPTKRVSKDTPKTSSSMSASEKRKRYNQKRAGKRASRA
jgi:hypothetical protein